MTLSISDNPIHQTLRRQYTQQEFSFQFVECLLNCTKAVINCRMQMRHQTTTKWMELIWLTFGVLISGVTLGIFYSHALVVIHSVTLDVTFVVCMYVTVSYIWIMLMENDYKKNGVLLQMHVVWCVSATITVCSSGNEIYLFTIFVLQSTYS